MCGRCNKGVSKVSKRFGTRVGLLAPILCGGIEGWGAYAVSVIYFLLILLPDTGPLSIFFLGRYVCACFW